jgi:hypothetical protein
VDRGETQIIEKKLGGCTCYRGVQPPIFEKSGSLGVGMVSVLESPTCYVREGLPPYLAEVSLHYLEFLIEGSPQVHRLLL